jgi:uncharacterized protein YqgC (DUF456 family)
VIGFFIILKHFGLVIGPFVQQIVKDKVHNVEARPAQVVSMVNIETPIGVWAILGSNLRRNLTVMLVYPRR